MKEAIFGSYANGAPGLDGLSFLFYQTFWDVIKADFMAMVRDFEEGKLDIHKLNFALIILIPKEPDANIMKKFRPISLSNCAVKFFSKVLTNRLSPISDRLISPNQTAFIKGRYILESVVLAHEVIHEVKKTIIPGLCSNWIMKKRMIGLVGNFCLKCLNPEVLALNGFPGLRNYCSKGPLVSELMIPRVPTL